MLSNTRKPPRRSVTRRIDLWIDCGFVHGDPPDCSEFASVSLAHRLVGIQMDRIWAILRWTGRGVVLAFGHIAAVQRKQAATREIQADMLVFAIRRLLQAIPILLGVSLVVFGLVHIVPGNPIDMLMPPEASPEVIAQMKAAFGFDKPLYMQYLLWLLRALHGDFGVSVFNASPVWGQLITALGNTFILAIFGATAWVQPGHHLRHDRGAASWTVAGQSCSPPSPPPAFRCRITGARSFWCWHARCCTTGCRRREWAMIRCRCRTGCNIWCCRSSRCR